MSSTVETSLRVGAVHRTAPTCPPKGLFDALDVYHDESTRSAAINMAIDEALLETATLPSIRFYQWDHPALSFGYFGKFDVVAHFQRDIVRRWTGGGIVLHGQDLTYSLIIPMSDLAFGESSISIYERTHEAIREALAANGQTIAALYERRDEKDSTLEGGRYNKDLCFANPVQGDLMLRGNKIAGAAQRRTRRGLLQQGSIQNVNFGNGFIDSFAQALCDESRQGQIDQPLLTRAEQIAAEKYRTSAWLHRR